MTIVEITDILLKIPNLTCRERTAVKTVVAMIDRKYMEKICDSYYSLDIQDLPDEQWRDVSSLDKNGKRKCMGIHVLVAKMFIPNPENKPMADHYDRNPANNAVWNLS